MDFLLYLGAENLSVIRSLRRGKAKHKCPHTHTTHIIYSSTINQQPICLWLSPCILVSSVVMAAADEISFCAVGHAETVKCDTWSINSFEEDVQKIGCQSATTVEDCMKNILVKQS